MSNLRIFTIIVQSLEGVHCTPPHNQNSVITSCSLCPVGQKTGLLSKKYWFPLGQNRGQRSMAKIAFFKRIMHCAVMRYFFCFFLTWICLLGPIFNFCIFWGSDPHINWVKRSKMSKHVPLYTGGHLWTQ